MSFFELSKILGVLIEPLNAIFILLVAAVLLLWIGKIHTGRKLLTLVVALLLMLLLLPLDTLLLQPLEERFPQLKPWPAKVDGIIMLGGAQQPRITQTHGQPALNGAAERMTMFVALARRYPEAKLVFSGGSGDILRQQLGEAETVRLFLEQQGFDASRVMYESRSRNTYENALHSKALVRPNASETWLLITSAADMPRAMGVFTALEWKVTPAPCDYKTVPVDWMPSLSLLTTMDGLDHALHEWIGLTVYYLTGKTRDLFPGPQS